MFYQIQFLDILLTGFAVVLLIHAACQRKLKGKICDLFVVIMILLFTISFLKDISYFRDYVKIISAFLLYFLGRYYVDDADIISRTLSCAFLCAFVINVIYCILGFGTVIWGNALTYRGLYFFKTDFTAMIAYFLLFYFIKKRKYNILDYILLFMAGYFTILANTRIYYLIFALLLCLILMYKNDQKLISVKNCMLICSFAVIGVLGVMILPRLSIFADRQMISLKINSVADLFNASNTQGRNKIWTTLFTAFFDQNILTQLLGAELSFNDKFGMAGFNEHSSYVKIVLNTGYIGLLLWVLFVIAILIFIVKEKNKKLSYLCVMLLIVYSIAGITEPVNLFTSTSWFPMLYCGMICGIEKEIKTTKQR